jgi:Domain of unknown function (DUF4173)
MQTVAGTVEAQRDEADGAHVGAAGTPLGAARRILTVALLLGVAADTAFRLAPDGLGWSLWVVALAAAALHVAAYRGLIVTREQRGWLIAAVLCAAGIAWRDAELLRLLNILGTLVAISLFAMTAAGQPAPSLVAARLRDIITAGLYTLRDLIVGAPVLVAKDAQLQALPAARGHAAWSVLRAALLTVPLVIVITVLLSRADPVFASVFSLPAFDVERLVSHTMLIGAFAWWSAGWLRGALLGLSKRPSLPDQLPLRLGLVEISTSLGAVILLFAVFVALQLRWLFGGADVVLATTGLTVAEYARRGFFELVAVAVIVLPLILVTHAVAADERVSRRHRHLSLALVVLLAAIMASAILRMRLYVTHFGLTADRLTATAIMLWLAVVLVAMAFTVLRGRSRPFAAITVLSAFGTLFTLNVLNPDLLVARVNLGRPAGEQEVDYAYLARLGGDATPTVVQALHAAVPSPVSCKAAQSLRARWLRQTEASWNLGARRGRTAVETGLPESKVQRLCAGVSVAR